MIVYKSSLAKLITFVDNFKTIMLFGVIFTEHESLDEYVKTHEQTHVRQYNDCATVGACLALFWMFILFSMGVQSWWMLLLLLIPVLLFYIWYGIEFLVRWIITRDREQAYEDISFERHARWISETWDLPCKDQNHYVSFGWLDFMKHFVV